MYSQGIQEVQRRDRRGWEAKKHRLVREMLDKLDERGIRIDAWVANSSQKDVWCVHEEC